MERITISLDEELAGQFDRFLSDRGYRNRSEAVRDLIRERLESERLERSREGHCIGTLTYVYNHHERELASRLTDVQHHHHDLALSTLHVHLDHDHCMETVVLQGPTEQVRAFADSVITRAGVRHGRLYLVPVEVAGGKHSHGCGPHTHVSPRT